MALDSPLALAPCAVSRLYAGEVSGLGAAAVVLWCMLAPCGASADQFTGKVVGISVLREGKAVRVS